MIASDPQVEPYASRREALLDRCPDGPIVVRGGDGSVVNPGFFYLTGIAEPSARLLISRMDFRVGTGASHPGIHYISGQPARQALFLPESDTLAEVWGEASDATIGRIDAAKVGVDRVLPLSSFDSVWTRALREASRAWIVRAKPAQFGGEDDVDTCWVRAMRDRFLNLSVEDATAAVDEMRRTKSEFEVAAIRKAIGIVHDALTQVYARAIPGTTEAELEGVLTSAYRTAGATHAFDPIVASGTHALQLHYTRNSGRLAAGDLLLIDTGARIDGYCADISRTIPVSGTFTDRQRDLYNSVRAAQQAAFQKSCAGSRLTDLHEAAYRAIDAEGLGASFVHGIGHHLGLEVHDVGDVHRPLDSGSVITIEPGVYVRDESVGIRLEDDVLITEYGHENLSSKIPADASAVEATLQAVRMGVGS